MQSNDYQLKTFLEYIRTKQFCLNALKDVNPDSYVHVNMNDIKNRFLVNPKVDIKKLVDDGELAIKHLKNNKGYEYYLYKVLKAGYYDLELLKPKGIDLTTTTTKMMEFLKDVSLKEGTPSTDYFNVYLNRKRDLTRLFFVVDKFSGRVHTPITSLKSEYRKNLLIDNEETISLDVVTMQPVLLGAILKKEIGDNEYSKWIDDGTDIYIMLQKKANLKTRVEAKKRFFEIVFSRSNNNLNELFGDSEWIKWINDFKSKPYTENPHTLEKNHSNLAYLLQSKEVQIMNEVWMMLIQKRIKFLSVHDEIIIKVSDYKNAKDIFSSTLSKHLKYFELSDNLKIKENEDNITIQINQNSNNITFDDYVKNLNYTNGILMYANDYPALWDLTAPNDTICTKTKEFINMAYKKPEILKKISKLGL